MRKRAAMKMAKNKRTTLTSQAPLSPLNDFVFKRLMGDREHIDLLAAFLQSVLDLSAKDLQILEIVDPQVGGQYPRDKKGILDIKVVTAQGKRIDIEIQVESQEWLWERLLFYTAAMVVEQIGEGENYDGIKRSITIVITDHHLTEKTGRRYHHRFILHDPEAGRDYPNLLEIRTLEIPKLPPAHDGSILWEWLKFFSARTEGEFEMTAKNNPTLKKVWGRLKELSADENERLLAQAREKERRDREAQIKTGYLRGEQSGLKKGRKEGIREGIREGTEKTQLEIALKALHDGMSMEVIARITGLSIEEIENLKPN